MAGTHGYGIGYVLEVIRLDEIKQVGNITPTATRDNPNQGRVYDPEGVSPTLGCMSGGGREPHVMEIKMIIDDLYQNREPRVYEDAAPALRSERDGLKTVEIKQVGSMGTHFQDAVYDPDGVGRTITARDYKDSERIVEIHPVHLNMNEAKNVDTEVANTICSRISQGITGFTREWDNGAVEVSTVLVKQATKEGYIPCKLGGGSRPELPIFRNTQRSGDRPGRCLSDSDNGEYP